MENRKKIFQFLSSILLYSLLVILGLIGVLILATGVDQLIGKKNNETRTPLFSAFIIISPSMVPNINVYDAVLTMRVPTKYIELYDIITFLSKEIETNGTPITHRVVGIVETESGDKAYRTKGDNNESEDRALIRQNEVLGKVMLRIPMIGYVKTFLSSKLGWILVVVVPCLGIVGYDILKITGLIKKRSVEEKTNKSKNKKEADELQEYSSDKRLIISDSVQVVEEGENEEFFQKGNIEFIDEAPSDVVIIPDDAEIDNKKNKGE